MNEIARKQALHILHIIEKGAHRSSTSIFGDLPSTKLAIIDHRESIRASRPNLASATIVRDANFTTSKVALLEDSGHGPFGACRARPPRPIRAAIIEEDDLNSRSTPCFSSCRAISRPRGTSNLLRAWEFLRLVQSGPWPATREAAYPRARRVARHP